jgi:hypothetical protein
VDGLVDSTGFPGWLVSIGYCLVVGAEQLVLLLHLGHELLHPLHLGLIVVSPRHIV